MQLFWRKMKGKYNLNDYNLLSFLIINSGGRWCVWGGWPYRIVKLLIVVPVVGSDPSLLLCRNRNRALAKLYEHST